MIGPALRGVTVVSQSEIGARALKACLEGLRPASRGFEMLETTPPIGAGCLVLDGVESEDLVTRVPPKLRRWDLEDRCVIVANLDPSTARLLVREWSSAVVWRDEVDKLLRQEVVRIMHQGTCQEMRSLLARRVVDRHPIVGRVADVVFLAELPPQRLEAATRAAAASRRSVRSAWREAGLPDRPEALIDWGLLCHQLDGARQGRSLAAVASQIGLEPWRIQRASRRRTGGSAGRLTPPSLLQMFHAWLHDDTDAASALDP